MSTMKKISKGFSFNKETIATIGVLVGIIVALPKAISVVRDIRESMR